MFLCESKITLFGLPKIDAVRNHSLRLFTTEQYNPDVQICATYFIDGRFVNLGQYKAGCTKAISKNKKRVNSDFAMTIWHF